MTSVKTFTASHSGCLLRIRSASAELKPAERAVADFVLAHPERAMQTSVSEAARDTGVGEATVIRFCRRLGYRGYQEFKLRLAQDLVEPVAYIHENLSFSDGPVEIAQKVFQTNQRAVEDTMKALDPAMVDAAARTIAAARRIAIFGVGYSSFTGLDAKLKFQRLGLAADAYGDPHQQLMAAALLDHGDVVIGISHSGSTKDIVESLLQARRSGAATIAVTNFSPSPITRAADVVLMTASPESPMGGEVLTSRIAQLCVIDVLAVTVAVTIGDRCLRLIERTSRAVREKRY